MSDKYGNHIVQYTGDYSFCAGCTSCELACSLVHDGVNGHEYNRIFLVRQEPDMVHEVYGCMQCKDHPCYDACPAKIGAMQIDEVTGIVYIDEEKCIGCGLCAKACPFEPKRINLIKSADKSKRKAKKCDLCRSRSDGGEGPACIEWCPVRCIGLSDEPLPEGAGIFIGGDEV